MPNSDSKTAFTVYEERCVGCGICVDACPMKILTLADDICVMTDISKCLECGTCIRDCPGDAIFIPGVKLSPKEDASPPQPGQQAKRPTADAQPFTPILEHLTKRLQELSPVQVFEFAGTDTRSLSEFGLEGQTCFYRAYTAEKLEKIGLSRMNFYGTIDLDLYKADKLEKVVLCTIKLKETGVVESTALAWPDDDHNLPILWCNLTIVPEVMNVPIFDFVPMMDIVLWPGYAETYVY